MANLFFFPAVFAAFFCRRGVTETLCEGASRSAGWQRRWIRKVSMARDDTSSSSQKTQRSRSLYSTFSNFEESFRIDLDCICMLRQGVTSQNTMRHIVAGLYCAIVEKGNIVMVGQYPLLFNVVCALVLYYFLCYYVFFFVPAHHVSSWFVQYCCCLIMLYYYAAAATITRAATRVATYKRSVQLTTNLYKYI